MPPTAPIITQRPLIAEWLDDVIDEGPISPQGLEQRAKNESIDLEVLAHVRRQLTDQGVLGHDEPGNLIIRTGKIPMVELEGDILTEPL